MPDFSGFAAVLATALALSVGVTKFVDLVRNAVDKNDTLPRVTWNVVAFVFGVALCLGWQIDLSPLVVRLIPALANSTLTGVSGQVLTGLVVGALAGASHEVLDYISGAASRAHSAAGER